ncbi:hypothetical protein O779_02632 [Staphylococcus aureus M0152]|nr:hypothetical protein O779_02632 [Staphylococcus aureus M0152]
MTEIHQRFLKDKGIVKELIKK